MNQAEIEAVVSERVLMEAQRYFGEYYTEDLAGLFRHYLLFSCNVIATFHVWQEMNRYKHKIKDKDLEQSAVVKKLGLKYLVSYDRDLEPFEEYTTPKKIY